MSTDIDNILVPTDFSEAGNRALETAIELCKRYQAVLHLLHVVENRYIVSAPEPGIAVSMLVNEFDEDAKDRLNKIFEDIIEKDRIPVQVYLRNGIAFDEICKIASEMPIDLIVTGTHGVSGVREFFLGTTAYSVIKNTQRPVLTVPADHQFAGFKKILFPVRPHQGISVKFKLAMPFIHQPGVNIHLAVLREEGESEDNSGTKKEVEEIIKSLSDFQVVCTRQNYICKNFASEVLQISEKLSADMIIINASLDYKWTALFMGPYTQQIVNHAKIPVLSYRDKEA